MSAVRAHQGFAGSRKNIRDCALNIVNKCRAILNESRKVYTFVIEKKHHNSCNPWTDKILRIKFTFLD